MTAHPANVVFNPYSKMNSNLRKAAKTKAKERAWSARSKTTKKLSVVPSVAQAADGSLIAGAVPLRVDTGTKACRKCAKGPSCHQAHDITCKNSLHYDKGDNLEKAKQATLAACLEKKRTKELKRKLNPTERFGPIVDAKKSAAFFKPAKLPVKKQNSPKAVEEDASHLFHDKTLLADTIKKEVRRRCDVEEALPDSKKRSTKKCPAHVRALADYLLELCPNRFSKTSNKILASDVRSKSISKEAWYRKHFPPGTLSFSVPKDDITTKPDPDYQALEESTIYLVRWELNIPGIFIPCFKCEDGEMIHDRYDLTKNAAVTPIFYASGKTDWAVAMSYQCIKCKTKCKGNDGRLINKLPLPLRRSYPVDCRFANGPKRWHLSLCTSRLLESTMPTYANGEFLSGHLYRQRGSFFEDSEIAYYSRLVEDDDIPIIHPTFEMFMGSYGPTGTELRNLYLEAGDSKLNEYGICERNRCRREMMAVGTTGSFTTDHTFETIKNYSRTAAKAVLTIGVDTGEIAVVALVPTTKTSDLAHAAEQFSRRPNVSPKVHFSDTWPNKEAFWKLLFPNIICLLGLFHFMHRIVSTLNKNHIDYGKAINQLKGCIYWSDQDDENAVRLVLKDGSYNGTTYSDVEIDEMKKENKSWKRFKDYVCIWLYPAAMITSHLDSWFANFKATASPGQPAAGGRVDPRTKKPLFTEDTKSAIENSRSSVIGIRDAIPKDELYLPSAPSKNAKSQLTRWLNRRGAESKLESFHLYLSHFANTKMRKELADLLGLIGTALHNLKIRERFKIDCMTAKERVGIPYDFRGVPRHVNHSRLAFINLLGRRAGVPHNVHEGVEALGSESGEQFFSVYLDSQIKRNKELLPHPDTDRCQCEHCAQRPLSSKRGRVAVEVTTTIFEACVAGPVSTGTGTCATKIAVETIAPRPENAVLNAKAAALYNQQLHVVAVLKARAELQLAMAASNVSLPYAIFSQPNLQQNPKRNIDCNCCTKFFEYSLKRNDPLTKTPLGRPRHNLDCINHASNKSL
jgi:hypothetical protein